MTTEIEKQFFEAFGIEPKEAIFCGYDGVCPFDYPCDECAYFLNNKGRYPEISDIIYLMLLATLTCVSSIEFPFSEIQELKEDILEEVIKHQYGFDKQQVQALFEEG